MPDLECGAAYWFHVRVQRSRYSLLGLWGLYSLEASHRTAACSEPDPVTSDPSTRAAVAAVTLLGTPGTPTLQNTAPGSLFLNREPVGIASWNAGDRWRRISTSLGAALGAYGRRGGRRSLFSSC